MLGIFGQPTAKTFVVMILDAVNMPVFLLLLGVIAFLYASVGHGGASGYLALMSAFAFPISVMKPTALLLNIFVSSVSFYFYFKGNYFKKNLFYPFAVASIPFSFIGGYLTIDTFYYKVILATVLLFAVLRILGFLGKESETIRPVNVPLALFIGASIGFLSGLLGIGGGIILSPILLLLGWATIKQSAAVSALFILVNSVSGLFGFVSKGGALSSSSLLFILVAFVGGLLGAFYGSKKLNTIQLRYILATVIGIAIVKLYTTA